MILLIWISLSLSYIYLMAKEKLIHDNLTLLNNHDFEIEWTDI